ncbi:unnamed protein product [Effrenium voratum]|nr:unnamed protein product [Effrenium voratum]
MTDAEWPEKAELERWLMNTVKDPDPGAVFLRQVLQMNPAYGSYLQTDKDVRDVMRCHAMRLDLGAGAEEGRADMELPTVHLWCCWFYERFP